jgi:hypothetical protein
MNSATLAMLLRAVATEMLKAFAKLSDALDELAKQGAPQADKS